MWTVVYKKAISDDGKLLFPERLSLGFLQQQRKTMGSYLYANQYQNEVIPDDERKFKKEWLRYYKELPPIVYHFGFIDPAIGQNKENDYTGVAIIAVDSDKNWYLRTANRYRLTPTQIVDKMFELTERFGLMGLGVETVAYQEALLYFLSEEMRRRGKTIPVKGIGLREKSKETRILSLVPRFEYGMIGLNQGMTDFEDEYMTFPRGAHDDILDSLASLEEIVFYPQKEVRREQQPNPSDPNYEKWYIDQHAKGRIPRPRHEVF